MFSGSRRSSPAGSRAGDEEDDDDEEALMLGERVGGVWGPGLRWEGEGPWGAASLRAPPSPPDSGSLDGDWEGLRDSPGLAVAAATAARRRARRGVSSTRLSSADRALRPAARPRRPRPCLGGGGVGDNTVR